MRKLALTVALFALALILVGVASAAHQPYPLFGMWVPLLAVPYVLTRPEAPTEPQREAEPEPLPAEPLEAAGPIEAAEPGAEAVDGTEDATEVAGPIEAAEDDEATPASGGPDRTAPAP